MVKHTKNIFKRIPKLLNNINQRAEDDMVTQKIYESDIYNQWKQKAKIHSVTIMMMVTMMNKIDSSQFTKPCLMEVC
jgi:hypothetical protein